MRFFHKNRFTVNPNLQNNTKTQRKPKQINHRSKRAVTEFNRWGYKLNSSRCYDDRPKAKTVTAIITLCMPKLCSTETKEKKHEDLPLFID